ncbi:MAG TPA: hypothetical protein VIL69_13640 [Roseomonas sp.]
MTKSDRKLMERSAAYAVTCIALALDRAMAQPLRCMLVEQASEAFETVEAVGDVSRDAFAPTMLFSVTAPNTWAESLPAFPSLPRHLSSAELFQAA